MLSYTNHQPKENIMVSTTTQNAFDSIIRQLAESVDTATLVDRIRGALDIPPKEVAADPKVVVINDPVQASLVNELLAQADQLKRVADAAEADREAIKELLTEVLGEKEILKVHNAEVFTAKVTTSRVLNQSFIKSRFPDIEGNEDYYKNTESRRRLFV
jgi:hypothetical protein